MIQWSLTLSEAQISVLKAFVEWDEQKGPPPFSRFSHFLSHTKGLLRDGLLVHRPPPAGSPPAPPGTLAHTWTVTEKGRAHPAGDRDRAVGDPRPAPHRDGLPVEGGQYRAAYLQVEAAKKVER